MTENKMHEKVFKKFSSDFGYYLILKALKNILRHLELVLSYKFNTYSYDTFLKIVTND